VRLHILIVLLVFLLIMGCTAGLKKPGDCQILWETERITCWHQAAVSEAYRENPSSASALCENIWNDVGATHIINNKKDDVAIKAESERNLCLYDIAKIIARQTNQTSATTYQFAVSMCDNIRQDSYSTSLAGAVVTQDMCYKEVNRTASIRPENYYSNPSNPDNICSVVFVLTPLVLLAFYYRIN